MAKGILCEAGTNEMELLEFRLDSTPMGINVAKVREIIQEVKTISIPHSPTAVKGSFMLRDDILSLIDLGDYFNMSEDKVCEGEGLIIVVEFNNIRCGILVNGVERIHRLSWSQIGQPSPFLMNLNIPVTGTVNIEDKTIMIIDFETVIGDILGVQSVNIFNDNAIEDVDEKDIRILFADDSIVMRKTITKVLHDNGYRNLTICTDGEQAWEEIQETKSNESMQYDLVLSDIEMPRMDGLHLTSKIKEDQELKDIPVILFSSLITEDNRKKGKAVGANAQISKPDSGGLIRGIEECMSSRQQKE